MRRRAFAIAIVLGISSTALAAPAGAKASQQQRLTETRRQLRAARSKLAALRRNDAALMSTIRTVQRQLDSAKGLLHDAQSTLAEIDARIKMHQRSIDKLQASRTARDKALHRRIAQLYMMGPGIEADALMSADSLTTFADRSSAFDFVLRADKINMEQLSRLADSSRKAQKALREEAAKQHVWRARVSDRVSLVWDALSTHKAAERALADRMQDYLREVRQLEREQRAIEDLINSRGSLSHGKVSLRGFSWPARSHHVNSPYGRRWGGFHTGLDVECSTGEPTYASKAGKVIASEWGGGYGEMIIIDHGNGVSTLYAHHSRLYVHVGQLVERGQRIGACGSTGNSTGSHVHFEIRINGHHTNPRPYLP